MNERQFKDVILALPAIRGLGLPTSDKKKAVENLFPIALNEITMSYDWDFTLDEASTVTVANQADYTLKGNDNDCRDIINVKYSGELITKMSPVEYDKFMVDRTHTAHDIWMPNGRDGGFPSITIASTPTAAGTAITYRYRLKNITLADFPNEFDYVIISTIVKHLIPEYTAQFAYDLRTMIDRHETGGGESNQVEQDWKITRGNNRRASLFGYGG